MTDNPTPTIKKRKTTNLQQLVDRAGFWKGMALILFAVIILTQVFEISITPKLSFLKGLSQKQQNLTVEPGNTTAFNIDTTSLTSQVLPEEGVTLPI